MSPAEPAGLVEVGHVARSHGLRGEVVVVLTTDRLERVGPGAELFSDVGPLVVRSARGSRDAQHRRWIVHFEGYADRDAADRLRRLALRAEPIHDPDALWAHDLVGAEVVVRGETTPVGRCVALVDNPAADLLELDTGALVPVVFVVETVDGDGAGIGRVIIDPPPGLFDL